MHRALLRVQRALGIRDRPSTVDGTKTTKCVRGTIARVDDTSGFKNLADGSSVHRNMPYMAENTIMLDSRLEIESPELAGQGRRVSVGDTNVFVPIVNALVEALGVRVDNACEGIEINDDYDWEPDNEHRRHSRRRQSIQRESSMCRCAASGVTY